jgi:hypothetical protein
MGALLAMSAPRPPLFLAYSTNVHPGEDLAAVYRFLETFTLPVKARVSGREPSGLELRLGVGSTRELRDPKARRALRDFLEASGLVLFSVNAYPLLDFHSRRVKERVYKPSWAEKARAFWTSAIARVFADLLAEGLTGSISTLGGAFRREGHGPATFRRLALNYLETIETLLEIEARQEKTIVLAVEPEPETTFETVRDVIDFFEGYLLPFALERWKGRGSRERLEGDLRRLFTVNLDTCHLSVLFEDLVGSLRQLERAGLRLGKVHVTNAVSLRRPFRARRGYEDLQGMDEPRYLHQFCGRDARGAVVWRGRDLSELPRALDRRRHPEVAELRSHFHVPVYLKRYRRLMTTQPETEQAVREVLRRRSCSHLVLETYTWPLLAGGQDQRQRLIEGIARELRWLGSIVGRET